MKIGDKTPIEIGSLFVLTTMAGGFAMFLMDLHSSGLVNAAELRAQKSELGEMKQALSILDDVRRDVAVIREKVDRIDADRSTRTR